MNTLTANNARCLPALFLVGLGVLFCPLRTLPQVRGPVASSQEGGGTPASSAQTQKTAAKPQASQLKLQKPVERELEGGGSDTYEIKVKKGQFLRVVAEQKGIDVVLALVDPSGKVLVEADSPNGAWGPEPASIIAATSGVYQAQVKSLDKTATTGKYSMVIAELRNPKPEDQTRIAAESELFAAAKLGAQSNDDSLQKSRELYEQASSLWHEVHDSYEEAVSLQQIGDARAGATGTENYKQAIDYYNRALPLFQETGKKRNEADILQSIGKTYYSLADMKKALEYYNQALPLQRAMGDSKSGAETLTRIGMVFSDLGEKQKALEYYNQSLLLQRAVGDRKGEAENLSNIGLVYADLGEKQKALDYYNQALPIERAAGNRSGEAATLDNIGEVYSDLGEKQKALEYLNKALEMERTAGNHSDEAATLSNIGVVYADLGEKQKALEYYNQALSLRRAAGDRSGESATLHNIGGVYSDLGEKQKALEYYNQALTIERALGDRRSEAVTLNSTGIVYYSLGEKQKALEYYNQAMPLLRAVGDRGGEAMNLLTMGLVYSHMGEPQKALEYLNQALALLREVGDRGSEATALNDIGGVYFDLGEEQKALEYLNQALPLERAVEDRSGQAVTLSSIGAVYADLGQQRKALEYHNQALPLLRAVGNRSAEAMTLSNIGYAYADLNEKQKALEYYNQALPLVRAVKDRSAEAIALHNIGRVYGDLGEKQKALDYYSQALQIEREVGDRREEAVSLDNIGRVYSELGEKQKGLEYLSQALQLSRSVQDPVSEGTTLHNLMLYWRREKKPSLAIFFGKQSVNAIQQVRKNIQGLDKSLQKSFLESKADTYRDLGDLLIAQGRLSEAQQVLDLLKEQEYFEFVRGNENLMEAKNRPISLNPEEQSSHEAYEKIAGQITAAGVEYSSLRGKSTRTPEEEARVAELKEKLTVANQEMGRFFKTLYVEFGKSAQGNQMAENVREQAGGMQSTVRELGPGTVALYTLVGETHYSVIVITASTMQAREYPIAAVDLRRKVAAFLEVLKNPASDPLPASRELYKILIGPIAEDLKGARAQTLMWSLNDVLRYVPMTALHDGKQYLVESYRNVVITPASIGRLKDKVDVANSSIAGMGVSKDYDGLGPLPAVPEELKHIMRDDKVRGVPAVLPGTMMLDDDFTEAHLAAALDKHYAVVHIASHFVLQAGNETNSYLLLGGKDVGGGKGYHLTLAELRDDPALTFDGTELLTLSACQTGTSGTALNGREVDGLGITAQQKGAKAVLASLWSVADESTALLMADFYKQWLGTSGTTKASALRQAQLEMLRGTAKTSESGGASRGVTKNSADKKPASSYTHPFYWAPFILIGNWK